MKKSLIALAALAATGAFAQSSVTLGGVIDAGVQKVSGAASTNKTAITNNGTATSRFDFRGTEDIGGGLKASFHAELDFNPAQSTTTTGATYTGTPFNGEQFVGLAGNFGSVKLGAVDSASLETSGVAQPFGTALGSAYSAGFGRLGNYGINQTAVAATGIAGARIIRNERVARYDSPVFSGFSGSVEYSFKNGNGAALATTNNTGYAALGLKYGNGPLNVAFAHTKAESGANVGLGTFTAANSDVSYNFLAANYNFGAFTGYAGYTTTKSGGAATATDSRSINVAGKVPVGAFDLLANYVKVDDRTGANADRTLLGLGADYNLSKRTAVYTRYESLKLVNTSAKQNTLALGIRHAF